MEEEEEEGLEQAALPPNAAAAPSCGEAECRNLRAGRKRRRNPWMMGLRGTRRAAEEILSRGSQPAERKLFPFCPANRAQG